MVVLELQVEGQMVEMVVLEVVQIHYQLLDQETLLLSVLLREILGEVEETLAHLVAVELDQQV